MESAAGDFLRTPNFSKRKKRSDFRLKLIQKTYAEPRPELNRRDVASSHVFSFSFRAQKQAHVDFGQFSRLTSCERSRWDPPPRTWKVERQIFVWEPSLSGKRKVARCHRIEKESRLEALSRRVRCFQTHRSNCRALKPETAQRRASVNSGHFLFGLHRTARVIALS